LGGTAASGFDATAIENPALLAPLSDTQGKSGQSVKPGKSGEAQGTESTGSTQVGVDETDSKGGVASRSGDDSPKQAEGSGRVNEGDGAAADRGINGKPGESSNKANSIEAKGAALADGTEGEVQGNNFEDSLRSSSVDGPAGGAKRPDGAQDGRSMAGVSSNRLPADVSSGGLESLVGKVSATDLGAARLTPEPLGGTAASGFDATAIETPAPLAPLNDVSRLVKPDDAGDVVGLATSAELVSPTAYFSPVDGADVSPAPVVLRNGLVVKNQSIFGKLVKWLGEMRKR
jgi:hypothetical protein